MSVDVLQEKIRKTKNPTMLELCVPEDQLPEHLVAEEGSSASALGRFCREVLSALKDQVPAVRFSFVSFAMLGPEGISQLTQTLAYARKMGYYVVLDAPETHSPHAAKLAAEQFFQERTSYPCDGVIISGYAGSDIWKPFLDKCAEFKKDLFVIVRTANKSASELQDLRSGNRLVHMAAADHVNRYGTDRIGKRGYSDVGIVAAASAEPSLKELRMKYPKLFMIMDGADYPNANAKKCAAGFDKFGYGAIAVVGSSVTLAWQENPESAEDYLQAVREAAERMKKNLTRYVTIL